jgi:hypothetical protein
MPVITLLTDYGLKDSYVAEMKGAILRILPGATLVDISHDVGNYSIDEGAFHMARSVPYFPEGTAHVGVVDPTVGSKRKAIIIKAVGAWLVGPDNGLLAPAAERLGVERVYKIENRELLPEKVSDVFDGRDTFGPAAALIASGVSPEELGQELDGYVRLPIYQPRITANGIEAAVIHVDGFGNLVTNVTSEFLEDLDVRGEVGFKVILKGKEMELPYVRRFSAVPKEHPLLLVAGGGYMELVVNQGNAQENFGLDKGDKIFLALG